VVKPTPHIYAFFLLPAAFLRRHEILKLKGGNVDWVTFLKVMVEDEKAAINKYQQAIEVADAKELKEVLVMLRNEEEVHIDLLDNEIRRLEAS
jgi:rubrerythrin